MADKRVLIKINYDKDKQRKALIDPGMVTVWHTRRILTVLTLLLILGGGIIWAVFGASNQPAETDSTPITTPPEIVSERVAELNREVNTAQDIPLSDTRKSEIVKRPPAIIFDKRVIRASLNTAPIKDEPGTPIKLPVQIEKGQDLEVFYFSQVKNMQAAELFHRWYKNGQLAYKKRFLVKTNISKLISSKKLMTEDAGEWQIVLVDNKGKVLSEINYSVNP